MQMDQFWERTPLACCIRPLAECSGRMSSKLLSEKIQSELRLHAVTDEGSSTNHNGMTRRLFLRATLAGGASLLAGRAATLFAAGSASDNSSFSIGGDLPVNRLGFGAMRLTGEGIWGWPPDRENALKVLRRAVELGANLIDTADAYGPETDELLIAEALYPYPKGLVIATKGGNTRPGPNQWVPDGRPEYLKQCVDKSLKRLKLERIDLYQLHRVDLKVPMEDSLGALKEIQSGEKFATSDCQKYRLNRLSARARLCRS
jgi:hypothetical protein